MSFRLDRAAAVIRETPVDPWTVTAPEGADPVVRALTADLDTARTDGPTGRDSVNAGDTSTFTCDGGAALIAYLADQHGIPARLVVGEYHHTDVSVRARIVGCDPSDLEPFQMDEHHHWVVLWPDDPDKAMIIDPNGPERIEPYVNPDPARYREFPPSSPWRDAAFDPNDTPADILQEDYPATWAWLTVWVRQPVVK